MRQKLVLFAVACLVALPLAAAPAAPVHGQAPTIALAVSAQQAVAPTATPACAASSPLPVSPIMTLSIIRCTTSPDCDLYCMELYGASSGECINFRCVCYF